MKREKEVEGMARRESRSLDEISARVATNMGITKKDVYDVLRVSLEEMKKILLKGETLNLTNFMGIRLSLFNTASNLLTKAAGVTRTESFRIVAKLSKDLRHRAEEIHDKLVKTIKATDKKLATSKRNKAFGEMKRKHYEETRSLYRERTAKK
jgi:anion-transporting  ArsA/GET3 family ATPase